MWTHQGPSSEETQKESLNYLACVFKDKFSLDQLAKVLTDCNWNKEKAYE